MRWGGKRLHIQVVGGEQPAELYSFLPLAFRDLHIERQICGE